MNVTYDAVLIERLIIYKTRILLFIKYVYLFLGPAGKTIDPYIVVCGLSVRLSAHYLSSCRHSLGPTGIKLGII